MLLVAGLLGLGGSGAWWARGRRNPAPVQIVTVRVDRPVTILQGDGVGAAGLMPNLYGLSPDDARSALLDAGVTPTAIAIQAKPAAGESGVVVDQVPRPGRSITETVLLGISVAAPVPSVKGKPEPEARRALDELGARVSVRRAYDPGAAEGTVLDTLPAEGQVLGDEVQLTVAGPASSVLLTELKPVRGDCSTGPTAVNARTYDSALSCSPGSDRAIGFEYLLNRRVSRFEATLGQADRATTGVPVTFRVFVDNRLAAEERVIFGETKPVSVDVSGGLRLRVEIIADKVPACCSGVRAVVGGGRMLGAPDAIDALVTESTG